MKMRFKRFLSGFMAVATLASVIIQPVAVSASELEPEEIPFEQQYAELKDVQDSLDPDEIVKANDIEPIVTLYHYDLPMALVDKYDGWISREVVKDFEYYARYVINEFKDKVKYWTTINEQSIIDAAGNHGTVWLLRC